GDGQRALHPGGLVSRDGAVELVGARLEGGRDGGRPAGLDDLAVLVDAVALDRDAVGNAGAGGIGHLEGDGSGLGVEGRDIELEGPGWVGAELDGSGRGGRGGRGPAVAGRAGGRRRSRAARGSGGRAGGARAAAAGSEGEGRGGGEGEGDQWGCAPAGQHGISR